MAGDDVQSDSMWFGLTTDSSATSADLVIFGAPYDGSVFFRRGAAAGPSRIRSLSSKLPPTTEDGRLLERIRVLDLGDVGPESDLRRLHERLRETFADAHARGLPLVLGGDHSVSIPLIRAAASGARGSLGLVWIDAHPDLCDTYQGSPFSHACVLRRVLDSPSIRPENVWMVGVRSWEVEEVEFMTGLPLNVLRADAAATMSGRDAGEEIVRRLSGMPVYLSIDIDAFDPAYAPGTGIPDAGGLTSRWVLDMLHALAPLDLIGVDLVEVAPPLDVPSDITSLLALKLILELLGNLRV